ncbi:hypothetical protein ISCGN_012303 [Ixodes scapularis]
MRERLDPHKKDRKRPRTEELQHVDETVALTEPPMEPDNEQDEEKEGQWIEVRRGNNAGVRKVRIKNDKPNTKLDIDHRTFNQTMKKAGISLENGARARIDPRTNDYIVTTKNEVEYERLCNLKKFTNEIGESTEIKVIPGLASNHSRGVIYLRNPGNDMEALCEEIICKTHQKPGKGDEHYRWIKRIQNITQHKSIVGGDFNAEHSVWGNQDNREGMNLLHQMRGNSFECLNKPGGNTRLGNKNQKDTTPDSSWTRGVSEVDWEAHDDTWGSDHVPIIITLHRKTREKRTARVTNWDKFREILKKKIQVEGPTDIEKHIKKAAQEATTTTQVDADAPNPDHHLTNLQEARHKALLRYRRKKTDTSRRIILNRATQEVTAYTRKLRKQTWIQHCEGFNDRTGVKKLWNTYRAMLGKKKEKNTGRNLALKLNMSEEELAKKLGETFFPQPDDWTPLLIEHTEERKEQDVKFSIEELNYAISRAKKGTAPGEDGVTPAMLKNLPDEGKHALLDHYNRIWEEHTLPQGWKHSTVIPIPKPNKPKDKMANLRPISLTSNILQAQLPIVKIQKCDILSIRFGVRKLM